MRQTSRRGVVMTITEENAQPHAATTAEGPRYPARSERRRRWRKVATWVAACSAVVLAAGGYLAVHMSSDLATARGRGADSARLQGQADLYAVQQAATARGRAADSARLQGQADLYAVQQAATAPRPGRGLGPSPRPSRSLRRPAGGHGARPGRGFGPSPRPSRSLRRPAGGHGARPGRGFGPSPRPSRRLAGTGTRRGVLR